MQHRSLAVTLLSLVIHGQDVSQLLSTDCRFYFLGQCKRVSGKLNKGNEIHGLCAAVPAEGRLQAWLRS